MSIIKLSSGKLRIIKQRIICLMRKISLYISRKRTKGFMATGGTSGVVIVGKRINPNKPEPSVSYEDYQRLIQRLEKYGKHSD